MNNRNQSTTLWLRPIENIKNYQVRDAARWLVKRGSVKNFDKGIKLLVYLMNERPTNFKYIMSKYFEINVYKSKPHKWADPNLYRHAPGNIGYGEPHMYIM